MKLYMWSSATMAQYPYLWFAPKISTCSKLEIFLMDYFPLSRWMWWESQATNHHQTALDWILPSQIKINLINCLPQCRQAQQRPRTDSSSLELTNSLQSGTGILRIDPRLVNCSKVWKRQRMFWWITWMTPWREGNSLSKVWTKAIS